jgi:hypothetical protein
VAVAGGAAHADREAAHARGDTWVSGLALVALGAAPRLGGFGPSSPPLPACPGLQPRRVRSNRPVWRLRMNSPARWDVWRVACTTGTHSAAALRSC